MQVYTAYTVKPPTDYFVYTPSMPSPGLDLRFGHLCP